jgi:hypothetical protein
MEKFTNKLLAIIAGILFISIIASYCVRASQYAKKHRELDNEIENYEKIQEYQFSCLRGDTTEFYANIAYIGNETDLVKAIHEFRTYLLDKSLGTFEDEMCNLYILKQTIESHNVIPVSIRGAGMGRWDNYEQLKEKL